MNEVEYMLRQDAREKKAAGRGIYHKRSGSKTKYVGLPSDHLTAAQMKRRNGPVSTFNISKRLTYAEFKELPTDLAQEYIDKLQRTYNVGSQAIAESLGITRPCLKAYAHKHNLSFHGKPGVQAIGAHWPDFLRGKYTSAGARTPAPEVEASPIEKPKPAPVIHEPSAPEIKAKLGDIDLGGSATPEAILAALTAAFSVLTSPDQTYEFAIHLHAEGGED